MHFPVQCASVSPEVKHICFNFRQTSGPGAEVCPSTDVKH